jgi:hypothetical protein
MDRECASIREACRFGRGNSGSGGVYDFYHFLFGEALVLGWIVVGAMLVLLQRHEIIRKNLNLRNEILHRSFLAPRLGLSVIQCPISLKPRQFGSDCARPTQGIRIRPAKRVEYSVVCRQNAPPKVRLFGFLRRPMEQMIRLVE